MVVVQLARMMLLVVAAAGAASCSTNNPTQADARVEDDAAVPDAPTPAPPALGAQIDRMGRAAITTLLVAPLAPDGDPRAEQRSAYERANDAATWPSALLQPNRSIEAEFKLSLAVFDSIDTDANRPMGCGNAVLYTGAPSAELSYRNAARIFADDQLYVDTSLSVCTMYLALELEIASSGNLAHTSCGGRTLTHDTVDMMYSLLAAGTDGLTPATLTPRLRDGVDAHTDVREVFPFLGAPHP